MGSDAYYTSLNGNLIYSTNGTTWYFAETGKPIPPRHGKVPPCPVCGELPTQEGHDHCLGTLPGVEYACCGHGVVGMAYVKFEDGRVVRGQTALDAIQILIVQRAER